MDYQEEYGLYHKPPTIETLRGETWNYGRPVHCWQHYIAPVVRDMWSTLTDDQLFGLWAHAESLAESEEWD